MISITDAHKAIFLLTPAWLLCLLIVISGTPAATADRIPWFYRNYNPNLPLEPRVAEQSEQAGTRREHLYFTSQPDQRIPTLLLRPPGKGQVPAVIFLHGIGQRKEFIDRIAPFFTERGLALVSFDQYDRGERRIHRRNHLQAALDLRRRSALTVIETRRLIDYLTTREDIAADRIYLVGASYGAITGVAAAAFEPRIQAVILTFGGGHLPTLVNNQSAREEFGWMVHPLRYLIALFFHPADPINYVAQISPRPLLMQNGLDDELIPAESARRLFAAAGDPKQIIWYDSRHIGESDAIVKQVVNDAVAWLLERDAEISGPPSALQP